MIDKKQAELDHYEQCLRREARDLARKEEEIEEQRRHIYTYKP